MSIGEVLAHLRPDFPDVSISKIRYLEAEGLVEPERTPSGYRKFSHTDVERLRYILTAQKENYYPLRVIREHLDAIDRGLDAPELPSARSRPPQVLLTYDGSDQRPDRTDLRLSRTELCESASIGDELLARIEGFGLVRASGSGHYDATAVLVATTVGELAAYGVEPRHLRAVRTAAERELDLVDQVVGPMRRQKDAAAQARADESARELAGLVARLHTTLVRAGVGRR